MIIAQMQLGTAHGLDKNMVVDGSILHAICTELSGMSKICLTATRNVAQSEPASSTKVLANIVGWGGMTTSSVVVHGDT